MKPIRFIAGAVLVLLLLSLVIASRRQADPLAVARRHCADQGIPEEKLSLQAFHTSGGPIGNTGTFEFLVQGTHPRKKLTVRLHQAVFFLGWRVVDAREEVQPR